jgi:hypothetical protein
MNMKTKSLVICLLVLLLLPSPALAQDSQPGLTLKLNRDMGYGGFSGDIQGTFSLIAEGPDDLTQVKFYLDDALLGIVEEPPYRIQFHTGSFDPGVHTMTAIGVLGNGEELHSQEIVRMFLSAEEANNSTLGIVVPMLAVIGVIALLAVAIPLVMGRKGKQYAIGQYSLAGGAVCRHCQMPFSRHMMSPNLVTGKLERCPHCGKLQLARRASPAELAAAEARLHTDNLEGQQEAVQSEEEKLRQMLEDSRFDE